MAFWVFPGVWAVWTCRFYSSSFPFYSLRPSRGLSCAKRDPSWSMLIVDSSMQLPACLVWCAVVCFCALSYLMGMYKESGRTLSPRSWTSHIFSLCTFIFLQCESQVFLALMLCIFSFANLVCFHRWWRPLARVQARGEAPRNVLLNEVSVNSNEFCYHSTQRGILIYVDCGKLECWMYWYISFLLPLSSNCIGAEEEATLQTRNSRSPGNSTFPKDLETSHTRCSFH